MTPCTPALLKTFDALKEVPEDQLQWLIDQSYCRMVPDGELLAEPGKAIAGTHFVITGMLRVYMPIGGVKREIGSFAPGDISGYLPFSRAKMASGYAVTVGESQLMTFPVDKIQEMIRTQFELTQALVHVMTNRVRSFTALQQQNEKMLALGKLSAGLAHELNNPASAIVRDSDSLLKHLKLQPEDFKRVISIQMSGQQVDAVCDDLFRILDRPEQPELGLRERTKKEGEMEDMLDELGISGPGELVENLVGFAFEPEDVRDLSNHIPKTFLSAVFGWINNLLVTERMVEDISESSKRIADLVASVKTYTHMDQAQDKQYADIHIGIWNTVKMLGYKFKKGNITLVKEFDKTLPPVKAMIGELNQVWTNLIDNALDAMEPNGKGTLTIRTERDREFVQVSIIDDGPGIPEEIRSRIFDPFFTTKELGKGTGMGLETVQRIVNQHRGSIKVQLAQGHTAFIVCFPING
ncbi:ATP-binding protein [Dinghuibacter silviterrae]|uniref:histidine kinase n=1 Tax=Dinghuibacter silviterrae TaxID=1539049 RepID=A0A4V3GLF8_9BACT|nr:ATP-binding protein [Dinghuibacter silviterrae]TDW99372.1 histidine kinase/DNA gyrase B/HSP90-like ATPase [Dinghuibacter silviterrae]